MNKILSHETNPTIPCEYCGKEVLRGIFNIAGHWSECAGREAMANVLKISNMPLDIKDKMDLVKNALNLNQ